MLMRKFLEKGYDKIRPKWDWKRFCYHQRTDEWAGDKIRPKWDWKACTTLSTRCPTQSIKSDQNGIENLFQLFYDLVRFFVIKSDQNGIENKNTAIQKTFWGEIKSDQNGIENWNGGMLSYHLFTNSDKIRPKWDWKLLTFAAWTQTAVEIKSDQNGIEKSVNGLHPLQPRHG